MPQRRVAERGADLAERLLADERGHLDGVPLARIERVAAVLDVRVDLVARWRGGDLARLLDAGHAALVE